jgi:O-antigen/teichoic acid export membrane protein
MRRKAQHVVVATLQTRGRRRITLGTVGQAAARGVGLVLGVAVSIGLARGLGRTDFGWMSFGLTIVAFGGIASDIGVSQAAARDIAAHPDQAPEIAGAVVGAALVTGLVAFVVTLAISLCVPSGSLRLAFVILCSSIVIDAPCSLAAVFSAHLRPGLTGVTNFGQSLFWATAVVIAALVHASPIWYALGFTGAVAVQSVASLWLAVRLQPLSTRNWRTETRRLVGWSWPIGLAAMLFFLYQRGPLLMLQLIHGPRALALAAGAWRFLDAAMLVPVTINTAFIPVLAGIRDDPARITRLTRLVLGVSFAVALTPLVALAPVAESFGRLVLSDQFSGIGGPLLVALAVFAVFCPDSVWGGALIASGQSRVLAWSAAVALGVATLLSVLLVPGYGASGAATAVLGAQIVRSAILGATARSQFGAAPWMRWVGALGAAGVSVAAVYPFRHLAPTVGTAAAAAAVYIGLLVVFGTLRPAEVRAFWSDGANRAMV